MKSKNFFLLAILLAGLAMPVQNSAYYPCNVDFGWYGPRRIDSFGCGYECVRRCPHIAPCCGTLIVVAAVAVGLIIKDRLSHHGHGHSHSDSF